MGVGAGNPLTLSSSPVARVTFEKSSSLHVTSRAPCRSAARPPGAGAAPPSSPPAGAGAPAPGGRRIAGAGAGAGADQGGKGAGAAPMTGQR